MSQHTKEPWGPYIEGAVGMTPNPDGGDAYPLSFEDYERARLCVNSCAGVPSEKLAKYQDLGFAGVVEYQEVTKERDALVSAISGVLSFRVGELPSLGYIRDNDESRKAIGALADAVAGRGASDAGDIARAAIANASPGPLLAERDALVELLFKALPYIEDADSDKAYKPGAVKKLEGAIRKALEPYNKPAAKS